MTAKFPRMGSDDIVRILHDDGFEDIRSRGSHLILFHPAKHKHATVPMGRKVLPLGTAKSILRAAGIDQF